MAGHSQFKNIMFRKGKQDKERSKLFAKLSREITVAAKSGLPDPAHNPRLRTAIIAAKQESMPKDNIERAIKKAAGGDAENYDEIRYEGRGPGGVALIVETMTDNRNRTAPMCARLFPSMAARWARPARSASCSTMSASSPIRPTRAARTPCWKPPWTPAPMNACHRPKAMNSSPASKTSPPCAMRWKPGWGRRQSAAIVWRAQTSVAVADEAGETLMKLIEVLDDHDDVQNVYGNYEFSDALMAKLGG